MDEVTGVFLNLVPTVQEDMWAPGVVWEVAEILYPPSFDTRIIQPMTSH